MESNQEQTLAQIEQRFEDSKEGRLAARTMLEAARGKFHMTLVARREAGEKLTTEDMKALVASAVNDVDYVRAAYLNFVQADTDYRRYKVEWNQAQRDYWDKKPIR